jgi:hypothetical protein
MAVEVNNKENVLTVLKAHRGEFLTPREVKAFVAEDISEAHVSAILGQLARRTEVVEREPNPENGGRSYRYRYADTELVEEEEPETETEVEPQETSEEKNKTFVKVNELEKIENQLAEYRAALAQRVTVEARLKEEVTDLKAVIEGMREKSVYKDYFEREVAQIEKDTKRVRKEVDKNYDNVEILNERINNVVSVINEIDAEIGSIRQNNLIYRGACIVIVLILLFLVL